MDRWPNLFLIGAPKAATTYLHDLLSGVDDVFCARNKEPAFFHYDGEAPTYKGRLAAPLSACLTEQDYRSLYEKAGSARFAIDASTHYLSTPATAARIASVSPDARIIAVVREPVSRAWSHYLMGRRDGFVEEEIDAALQIELKEMAEPDVLWSEHYRFIRRSLYLDGLAAYHDAFGADRMRVYDFAEVTGNLTGVLEDLGEFLDLDLSLALASQDTAEKNAFATDRFPALTRMVQRYREGGFRRAVNRVLPEPVRKALREGFDTARLKEAPKPELPDEARQTLEDHCAVDWAQTLQFIERHQLGRAASKGQ